MSYPRTGEDVKLRINHRGGADGARQTDAAIVIDRIPANVLVSAYVTQPTVLPQTDQAQTSPGSGYTDGLARYVFERGARLRPRTAFGVVQQGSGRGRVLVAGPTPAAFGSFGQIQVEPVWAPVGTSVLTVIDYTLGAGDTVGVTPLGGAALTLTEGVDFAAATDNATTAENIRVALLAIGIVAVRTGDVLLISTPLDALTTGDVTAWTVALSPPLVPPPTGALIPKGREEKTFAMPADDPNEVPDSQVPAGELLRIRLLGATAEVAENQVVLAGGELAYSGRLIRTGPLDSINIAPGSVVFNFGNIGGNAVEARDRGDGTIVGQAASPNLESVLGTINYFTGEYEFVFSAAAGSDTPTADYERDTLYLPLDVHLEWDAILAYG